MAAPFGDFGRADVRREGAPNGSRGGCAPPINFNCMELAKIIPTPSAVFHQGISVTENIRQTSTEQTTSDPMDWLDNSTGIPANGIMAKGEGVMIFNPGRSPMEVAFSVYHK